MHESIVCPPYSRRFSDDIISSVMQLPGGVTSPRRASSSVVASGQEVGSYEVVLANSPRTWATSESAGNMSPTDGKRKRFECTTNTSSKRVQLIRGPGGCLTKLVIDTSVADLLDLGKRSQQKQRRENQRRYRRRQADWASKLETSTHHLRNQIATLTTQRKALSTSSSTDYNLWNVAVEYFRAFEHGLLKSEVGTQLDFVRNTMACDVASNIGYGPEVVMRGWYFSQWFDAVDVKLQGIKRDTGDSLIAMTETSMTISERTLRIVFPTLRSDEMYHEWESRLLGRRLTFSGSTCFRWDATTDRVSSLLTHADLVTPILHLLGSLENVTRVFSTAILSLDFRSDKFRVNCTQRTVV